MTRPLYLPLHRVTLADEVEQAEAEMARNTHTRPARLDEPDTIITDFGGMAEARPNIVRRAFDAIAPNDAELLAQLKERSFVSQDSIDEYQDAENVIINHLLVSCAVIAAAFVCFLVML